MVHIQGSLVGHAHERRENDGGGGGGCGDLCVCVHRWGQAQRDEIGLKICSGLFSPLTLMLGN